MKWIQKNWLRLVFFFGLLYTTCATLYFGEKAKPTEMGLALATGAIIMTFGFIDRIKAVKTTAFEMEIREKLDQAYTTLDNLSELAISLAKPIEYILSRANIPGMKNELVAINDEMINDIRKFSSNPKLITSVKDIFDGYQIAWYISQIYIQMGRVLDDECLSELRKMAYETDHRELAHLEPSKIRQMLSGYLSNPSDQNLVSQLEYFIMNRKFQK